MNVIYFKAYDSLILIQPVRSQISTIKTSLKTYF